MPPSKKHSDLARMTSASTFFDAICSDDVLALQTLQAIAKRQGPSGLKAAGVGHIQGAALVVQALRRGAEDGIEAAKAFADELVCADQTWSIALSAAFAQGWEGKSERQMDFSTDCPGKWWRLCQTQRLGAIAWASNPAADIFPNGFWSLVKDTASVWERPELAQALGERVASFGNARESSQALEELGPKAFEAMCSSVAALGWDDCLYVSELLGDALVSPENEHLRKERLMIAARAWSSSPHPFNIEALMCAQWIAQAHPGAGAVMAKALSGSSLDLTRQSYIPDPDASKSWAPLAPGQQVQPVLVSLGEIVAHWEGPVGQETAALAGLKPTARSKAIFEALEPLWATPRGSRSPLATFAAFEAIALSTLAPVPSRPAPRI